MYGNVGEGGNDLLLRGKVCALFEFKVANGAGEGEVAVDAAKVDETARCTDACLFTCE